MDKPQDKPKLLSGGNPQIPKGYGEAPIRAYIAAMPGWKRDIGQKLDDIISRTLPGVKKAVKWNSPLRDRRGALVPELSLHDEIHQDWLLSRRAA